MWLHGDNTICNLPPRSDELNDSPPPFFTGGAFQAECQHGNTVILMEVPGLICNSCGEHMSSAEEEQYGMCMACHAEGRT